LGKNAGCKTVYLLTGHGVRHLEETVKAKPDYIAANLRQAADFILFDKSEKIISLLEGERMASEAKKKGKKVVTLNGAFDILHKGHRKIIAEAKEQGDVLIVAVNSDESVRKNKGENRPLNNEKARASMVASFDEVEHVIVFSEETPIPLLEKIKPDVHVNGSEYGEDCIEAPTVRKNGGRIHVVQLLEGFSTSKMLEGKMGKK